MDLVVFVTSLILLEYVVIFMAVGKARVTSGIEAPAVTGDPVFERHIRVQQNTVEQLVLVLPAMWLFASVVRPDVAAGLGMLFVIGRFMYFRAYVADPKKRGTGFIIGGLATLVMVLGAVIGSGMKLL